MTARCTVAGRASFAALLLFLDGIAGNSFQSQDIPSCPSDKRTGWRSMTMGADTQGAVLVQMRFTQKSSRENLSLASHADTVQSRAASGTFDTDGKHTAARNATKHEDAKALWHEWDDSDGPSAISCILVLMSVPAMVFSCVSVVLMYSFLQDKREAQAARRAHHQQSKLQEPVGQRQFLRAKPESSHLPHVPSTASTASPPCQFFIGTSGDETADTASSLSSASCEHTADQVHLPPALAHVQSMPRSAPEPQ